MMASLDFLTWVRLFVWLAIGLAIYFGYSRYQQPPGHHARGRAGESPTKL